MTDPEVIGPADRDRGPGDAGRRGAKGAVVVVGFQHRRAIGGEKGELTVDRRVRRRRGHRGRVDAVAGLGGEGVVVHIAIVTSFLSGIFGMAGGMILMGLLLALMPLPAAMVLHGVTQLTSNGWRAWLWRAHIDWRIVGRFAVGSLLRRPRSRPWRSSRQGRGPHHPGPHAVPRARFARACATQRRETRSCDRGRRGLHGAATPRGRVGPDPRRLLRAVRP